MNGKYVLGGILLLGGIILLLLCLNNSVKVTTTQHLDEYSLREVVPIRSYIDPRINDNSLQLIPRVIIQTNDQSSVPTRMKEAMETIISKNPEYTYRYFTDADRYEFIKKNFDEDILRAYRKIIPGAFKADLFRYCYLYKNGGIYIDSSMICKKSLSAVIQPRDVFIAAEDNGSGNVYNAVIMASPYSPILFDAIQRSVSMILSEQYGNNMLDITGPGCLRDSFKNIVAPHVKKNADYGSGIRLLSHDWYPSQHDGTITDRDSVIFRTKYQGYKEDKLWYNTVKNYAILWEEHNIYHRDI